MGRGFQNPDLSLEGLYEQAQKAQPEFSAFGNSFMQYLKGKYPQIMEGTYFESGPLKKMERIISKAQGDYNGDVSKISDIVITRFMRVIQKNMDYTDKPCNDVIEKVSTS
jgi:hypothetical protein